MSSLSTIYDSFQSLIETELPAYKKIPNPYFPDTTGNLLSIKSYGIVLGAGFNTERYVGCKITIQRTFQIILLQQITTTDHNLVAKATIEKQMFEDQWILINALEKDTTLAQSSIKTKYTTDSGLQFLDGDRNKYFLLISDFESEYQEDFT